MSLIRLTDRFGAAAVFAISATLRLLFFLKIPNLSTPDSETYRSAGESLLRTGLVDDPRVMPLYPLLYAVSGETGIRIWGLLFSSLSAVLVFLIAREMSKQVKVAVFAGLLFAFYPYFIYFSVTPLTETLFIFLFLIGVLLCLRRRALAAGVIWILAILVRPTLDYLAPILLIFTALFFQNGNVKTALRLLAAYAVMYALLLTPWWIHNERKYDRFVRLNLGLGITLYAGNVNMAQEGFLLGPGGENLSVPEEAKSLPALEIDRYLTTKTVEFIRAHPDQFAYSLLVKAFRLWKPFPDPGNHGKSKAVFFAGLLSASFLMLGTISYFVRSDIRRNRTAQFMALIFIYFTAVHVLTLASVRYRLPLDSLMTVLAALGWAAFFPRFFDENRCDHSVL
jgi:hypothetical protein